jgi:predicted enzyme related to lactoylglutathione lyase
MTNTTTPGAPIGWFEIGTDDPATARAFYGSVLGWTFEPHAEGTYWIVTTGEGHTLQGGIQDTRAPLPDGHPPTYAVPCALVPDVAAACAAAEANGGKTLVPATSPPGGLTYGMIADPAGNRIGVFTPPPG